jgi:hypothetical protein
MSIKKKIMLIRNFNTFESQYHASKKNSCDKQEREKIEQMSDEIRRSIEERKYQKDLNIHFLCLINSFIFYSNYFGI